MNKLTTVFIVLVGFVLLFTAFFWQHKVKPLKYIGITHAHAHEHMAGESEAQARVVEFYKTWKRPKGEFAINHRQSSCCYGDGASQDCFPVLAMRKDKDGFWEVMPDVTGAHTQAQAEYGGKWYSLRYHIGEDEQPDPRSSPDGRSHVCVSGQAAVCYVPATGS